VVLLFLRHVLSQNSLNGIIRLFCKLHSCICVLYVLADFFLRVMSRIQTYISETVVVCYNIILTYLLTYFKVLR